MGFFSSLVDAASSANETAHGVRLSREFFDSLRIMESMPRETSDEIIRRYVVKRSRLKPAMGNWTENGFLTMAKTLKDEARRVMDLNLVEGYALWMASTWLECNVRKSDEALYIFNQLDGLARAHEVQS